MKKLLLTLAAVLGLGSAFMLRDFWQRHAPAALSRHSKLAPVTPVRPTPPAPASPAPVTIAPDPVARAWIEALERILARVDVRPGETVLTFKDDAALARFVARASPGGLTILGRLDALRSLRIHFDDLAALRDELRQNAADYADVSGNYVFVAPPLPTREFRAATTQVPFGNDALPFIGARGDRSQWGRGVTVAILDTGVAADATFGAGRLRALDIGWGATPGNGPDAGHGTSVASLAGGAAADAPGAAPASDLLSIRVTDRNGTSDIFTISDAIVRATDAGARVINVSLGGYGTNGALSAAIEYALARGAVIVAAAGNDQAAQLAWPAADPRVVSVGAVDKAGQQVSFSNSGPQLQLSAPGYGIQTAWLDGQRAYVDGTSASAPLVAGAIAALMSQNPGLSAADAAQRLTRTADDAGAPGADPAFGHGILDVGWAMNATNPAYIDTAVSSHSFDAARNEMDFVVQNRSGQAVSALTLAVTAGPMTTQYLIPSLSPGQSQVITVPVDTTQLGNTGRITYLTTLTNPIGLVDQIPGNNRRTSVLTAPAPRK